MNHALWKETIFRVLQQTNSASLLRQNNLAKLHIKSQVAQIAEHCSASPSLILICPFYYFVSTGTMSPKNPTSTKGTKGKGGRKRAGVENTHEGENKKVKVEKDEEVIQAQQPAKTGKPKNDEDYDSDSEDGVGEDEVEVNAGESTEKTEEITTTNTKTEASEKKPANVIVPSPKKKDSFDLVDSDEDDNSDDDSDEEAGAPKCYITLIVPDGKHTVKGFAIHMDGYADKVLADILFNNSSKNMGNFKKYIGFAGRVIKPTNSEGNEMKNPNGFPYRALLVVTNPSAENPTGAYVKQWYKDSFLPAFKKIVDSGLRDNQFPSPTKEVRVVKKWQEFLGLDDFKYVIKRFNFLRKKQGKKEMSMDDYLTKSKEHLYSFFKVGTMNKAMVRQYNIPQKFMDPVDVENLKKKKKKKDGDKK